MAITADKELTLGVLFSGRVDESFKRNVNKLRTALGQVTKATVGVTKTTKAAGAPVKKTADEFSMLGKRISGVAGGFQRLTNAMKVTASYGLAAAAIFGVINALKGGTKAIVEFDQAMKNLQAITGSSDAEIGALGETIKYVASTTKFSAQEVAEAAILLGQAGFTAAESLEAIEAVANLATGTLSNMKDVADLMTTAVRAFGMEAADSAEIADIFASAVNKSKLTIDKLRTAFNYLGPVAKQADISLRETATGAMILANAGFRASTIGTGFRQVLARLVAPSEKLKTIFKAAGADLDKLNPATNDFKVVMGELSKVLGESVPKAERARRAFALFGLRGAAAASAFAQAGVEGFEKFYDEVSRVGTASEMAEKQMEGLGVMAKNLRDKFGILAVEIGEGGIAGAFEVILKVMRLAVSLITVMASTIVGKLVVAWTALTVVILSTRLAIRYLIVQLVALSTGLTIAQVRTARLAMGMSLLQLSMMSLRNTMLLLWQAALAHPWVALIAVIAGVIAGFVTYRRHLQREKQAMEEHAIAIKSQVVALEKYSERLDKTSEDQKEHASIMERLIEAYPELVEHVNLATMQWTDEGEALKDLIEVKKKAYLQDQIAIAVLEQRELETLKLTKARQDLVKTEKGDIYAAVEKGIDPNEIKRLEGLIKLRILTIAESLKTLGKDATYSAREISWYIMSISNTTIAEAELMAEAVKKLFDEMVKPKKVEQDEKQLTFLDTLKARWVNLYLSLSTLRKVDLFQEIAATEKKIETFRKAAEERLVPAKEIIEMEEAIWDEVYRKFVATEDKKEKKRREFFEKLRAMAFKHEDDKQAYEELKARQTHEGNLRKAKELLLTKEKYNEAVKLSEEALQEELAKIQDKYDEKYLKDRLKTIEDEYKRKEISLEYYLNFLDEARKQDLIDEEEYTEKKISLTEGWVANLKYGLQTASRELQSFGEMWQEIGEDIVEEISDNFVDAIWDFGEGTTSAKEAFTDFARDTLKWISQMILKLITMRLLMSAIGFGTTAGSGGGQGMPGTAVAHSGARIGKDMLSYISRNISPNTFAFAPRLHGGLRADEYPAILQSGETVLPRGQSPVNIEVINNTPAETQVFEDEKFGEKFIKIVVGQVAEDINKGGPAGMAVLSQVGSGLRRNRPLRNIMRRTL